MTDTAPMTADEASDLWRAMVDTWNGASKCGDHPDAQMLSRFRCIVPVSRKEMEKRAARDDDVPAMFAILDGDGGTCSEADLQFVLYAPSDVGDLLAEVRRLQKLVDDRGRAVGALTKDRDELSSRLAKCSDVVRRMRTAAESVIEASAPAPMPARDTPRSAETGQPMPTDQNAQETGT